MYQVWCFYHKTHNSFTILPDYELPQEREILLQNTLGILSNFKHDQGLQILALEAIYIQENGDIANGKFQVRGFAGLNFGYGKGADSEGKLELTHLPETAFIVLY